METIEVQVLDNQVNSPVIKLPTRRFPGVLIQGDTLASFYGRAKLLQEQLELNQPEKISDEDTPADLAAELVMILEPHLWHYESVLKAYGIDLPYFPSPLDGNKQNLG